MTQTTQKEMVPGTKVDIGGHEFIVPPLNFGQLEEFQEQIATAAAAMDNPAKQGFERMLSTLPIIVAAMSRNYPDFTIEFAKNILDLSNYRRVFEAVMGVSGISDAIKANTALLGESKPAAGGHVQ
jgi:hypothetical protein